MKQPTTFQEKKHYSNGLFKASKNALMETKQKIRENGNKDFIYTSGYESRFNKKKKRWKAPRFVVAYPEPQQEGKLKS